MSNYVRTGQLLIRPLLTTTDTPAIDLAAMFYKEHSDMNFGDDLVDYCRTGYVVIRPKLFGMVKPHRLENGEDAWHIQMVVGNLLELLTTLPAPLPWVTFCRNNQPDKMRIVKWDRFQRLARRMLKGNQAI